MSGAPSGGACGSDSVPVSQYIPSPATTATTTTISSDSNSSTSIPASSSDSNSSSTGQTNNPPPYSFNLANQNNISVPSRVNKPGNPKMSKALSTSAKR